MLALKYIHKSSAFTSLDLYETEHFISTIGPRYLNGTVSLKKKYLETSFSHSLLL